ncbi:MAG TPA: nickel-binding protein [Solirubrobacteraceae bacterium]|nr:nickel-binding protein [Solirubrobacteraceae bacterium]
MTPIPCVAVHAYLVERYLPGLAEADVRLALRRAEAACAALRASGTEIHYRGSIFLALEEACFCRFDSERAEAVTEANQRAGLAFARVSPGVAIEPSSLNITQLGEVSTTCQSDYQS